MRLALLDEQIKQVEGEVVEDDFEEEDEDGDMEADLNTALTLLEQFINISDDLIDDRLNAKNRISFKMGQRLQNAATEAWKLLKQYNDPTTIQEEDR